jgi:pimeloyl-ACP methyl ester carboxylesterase
MDVRRQSVEFESRGTRCAGGLYLPEGSTDPPVVVLAHGFGGRRSWRLPAYAKRFAARGLAALVFDYRGFGDSDGTPRSLVDPARHVEDWQAALEHVRGRDDVGDDVGLWGTSFGGGHVLVVAARDDDVDAVVAQVPFVDGLHTAAHLVRSAGVGWAASLVGPAVRDVVRSVTRRPPVTLPLVGDPGEAALLTTPGAKEGVESIVPDDEDPTTDVPARIAVELPFYRPLSAASDVDCPVFVAQAAADRIVPPRSVDRLVRRLDDVERVRLSVGHFDGYRGEAFDRLVRRQGRFLDEHLRDDD